MRSVLITGADGFVGRQLTSSMHEAGASVVAVVRQQRAHGPAGVKTICVGDLCEWRDWDATLIDVDAVIHLAARTSLPKALMIRSARSVKPISGRR